MIKMFYSALADSIFTRLHDTSYTDYIVLYRDIMIILQDRDSYPFDLRNLVQKEALNSNIFTTNQRENIQNPTFIRDDYISQSNNYTCDDDGCPDGISSHDWEEYLDRQY
jgi:hypothetical protein